MRNREEGGPLQGEQREAPLMDCCVSALVLISAAGGSAAVPLLGGSVRPSLTKAALSVPVSTETRCRRSTQTKTGACHLVLGRSLLCWTNTAHRATSECCGLCLGCQWVVVSASAMGLSTDQILLPLAVSSRSGMDAPPRWDKVAAGKNNMCVKMAKHPQREGARQAAWPPRPRTLLNQHGQWRSADGRGHGRPVAR